MVRHRLKVIIFLIDNEGYTIERFIHGLKADYNDIAGWKCKEIPRLLGASESDVSIYEVRTKQELEVLLLNSQFADANNIQVCEMFSRSGGSG